MKTALPHGIIVLALVSAFNFQTSTAFAQGSLTPPPGAPAPTMKSLDQVEARTIVNAANTPGDVNGLFNISQPGSYYLTTNLTGVSGKNGIKITANNVTLDLNGFAVQGVSGSSNGIWIPNASTNITVRNGAVSGWGVDGVSNTSFSAGNLVCERLNVSSSGADGIYFAGFGVIRDCNSLGNNRDGINCPGNRDTLIIGCNASDNAVHGIAALTSCNIKDCTVASNSQDGILAQFNCGVISCTAIDNGSVGISTVNACTVKDCTTIANRSDGISTGNNCTVKDCTAIDNGSVGIATGDNCTVKDCTTSANDSIGISTGNNCTVEDCVAGANTQDGIDVIGSNCQITGNTCSGNFSYGILITGGQNRIDNNSVGNNTSYGINASSANVKNCITRNSSPGPGYGGFTTNNDYAPIGSPNTSTNPWQNFQ